MKEIIEKFGEAGILVVGDIMLDQYIWGKVRRISPEAPVPIVEVTREDFRLGGAGNVVNNIVSLGGKARVAAVAGDDNRGRVLKEKLRSIGVSDEGIFHEYGRQQGRVQTAPKRAMNKRQGLLPQVRPLSPWHFLTASSPEKPGQSG